VLISWNYPADTGLKYWIDKTRLHPVTCLLSLTKKEKQYLLEKGIVLCNQLNKNLVVLQDMGLAENQIKKIIREAENLIAE
jgi:hypothetical protein